MSDVVEEYSVQTKRGVDWETRTNSETHLEEWWEDKGGAEWAAGQLQEQGHKTRIVKRWVSPPKVVDNPSPEYIAEWCDNGVWKPIEMDMFDGVFPNLRAAQGYITVAKTLVPYEKTRIVRRMVISQEVINE